MVAAPRRRPFAVLVIVEMPARVPAIGGHVDPAAEGEPVVDHRDLVVMARTGRVRSVELEVDLVARRPAGQPQDGRPSAEQFDRANVPLENVDLQAGPVLRQPGQEGTKFGGRAVVGIVVEADPGIEVPADQQDLLFRTKHRLPGEAKVIRRVDDQAGTAGSLDSPAIPACFED